MNDSNSREFWQRHYLAGTMGWDRGDVHPALPAWIECGELSPCQIVVPGCGHGHEVVYLCERRFDVTAIDYAAEPIEYLSGRLTKENLSATLVHRDLFCFEPTQPFDAVYEQTCLCALQPDLRASFEDRVFKWLRPGGKLFLLMVQTEIEKGPPYHCDPGEMEQLFSKDRWVWHSLEEKEFPHPCGQFYELGAVLIRKQEQIEHVS